MTTTINSSFYNGTVFANSTGLATDDEGGWKGVPLTWVRSPIALYVSLVCAAFACVLSFIDINQHRKHYERPRLQRPIIRLLFMLPFYGVLSFVSMWLPSTRFVLLTVRDTYEAFALYQFMSLMVAYAGGEGQLIYALEQKRYKGLHLFPCCCLPLYKLNRAFFLRCKRYILQYALIKPAGSLCALLLTPLRIYREADYDWGTNLYPWVVNINNVSISYALYYLVLFELECERELAYCKAGLKFLCIKGIIFFAFWQSWLVGVLIPMGVLYVGDTPEEQEVVVATLQEFLICVELAPIAIAHHFAFNLHRLEEELRDEPAYESADALSADQRKGAFDEALSLADVFQDTIATIFYRKGALIADASRDADDDDNVDASATGKTAEEMEVLRRQEEFDILQEPPDVVDSDSDAEEEHADTFADNIAMALPPMPSFLTNVFNVMFDAGEGDGGSGGKKYCVVCGRSDRDMIKRKSGYKCKECVGSKHQYNSA